jgi:hypothetical protein
MQRYHTVMTSITFVFSQKTIPASLHPSPFEEEDHKIVIVINHRPTARSVEIQWSGSVHHHSSAFQQSRRGKVSVLPGGKKTLGCLDLLCFCCFFAKGEANGRSTMHANLHLPWAFSATLCRCSGTMMMVKIVKMMGRMGKVFIDDGCYSSRREVGCLLWK